MAVAGGAARRAGCAGAEPPVAGGGAGILRPLRHLAHRGRGGSKDALLQVGRSKRERDDCRLVTLALSLDGLGLPRHDPCLDLDDAKGGGVWWE